MEETDWKQLYEKWYGLPEEKRKETSDLLLKLSQDEKKFLFQKEPYARRIYVEKLRCFDNEDHLLLLLYSNELGEKYPKVTTIARTKLTPDIDLLRIERPYGREPLIIGYETKVLGKKRVFDPFYTGLGETLCYFRYGVSQAWLIIGIPSDAPNDVENRLKEIWEFLKKSRNIPAYVGLRLLREERTPENIDRPEGNFLTSSHEHSEFMRQCLLREKPQFTWSKHWIKTFISN